jgi:hypothetical protein
MKIKFLRFLILFTFLLIIIVPRQANSQVLLSLLFGDKLNSDGLEFGLDGGLNLSNMSNTEGNMALDWNLGFFFYIDLTEKSFLHTGVLVKSKWGTNNLNPYPTGDAEVDSLMLEEGTMDRNISYFNVPISYCHYIYNGFFLEGGFMLGLRTNATDEMRASSVVGDEVVVKVDISNQMTRLDAGLLGGAGYKFQKGLGVSVGVRYYYGLVEAHTDNWGNKHNNSNLFFFVTAPIGKGKAQRKREEKENQLREQEMQGNQ